MQSSERRKIPPIKFGGFCSLLLFQELPRYVVLLGFEAVVQLLDLLALFARKIFGQFYVDSDQHVALYLLLGIFKPLFLELERHAALSAFGQRECDLIAFKPRHEHFIAHERLRKRYGNIDEKVESLAPEQFVRLHGDRKNKIARFRARARAFALAGDRHDLTGFHAGRERYTQVGIFA